MHLHIYGQHVVSSMASAYSQSAYVPSTCVCLLEDTGRNGQVHTCVTMAGAKQNVQALCLDGPIRVHIHSYGGCPRLQAGLGQGTAAACVSQYTPRTVMLLITSSNSAFVSACGVLLSGKSCLLYRCGETTGRSVTLPACRASPSSHAG